MRSRLLLLAAVLALILSPARGEAFCGFYVSGAGGPLVNDATQVVLLRSGIRTVLSMQNDYHGPPESFALVIPVPVVLHKENVRTLPRSVFDHVEKLDGPRLVEYWEQDPCPLVDEWADNKEGGTGTRAKGEEGSMGGRSHRPLVTVEAEFTVDEYEIVILSALDAVALDTWLRENHYRIPEGADRYLRPYVEGGSKFFVARVDPRKIKLTWGRATLSPLRFFYDSEAFSLPVRLGLMNADGPQDLVVHILAAGTRFETANYDNLIIPTNLEVADATRDQFPSFYASLFDRTVAGHPRAVVTEYAWSARSCDPCPQPPLSDQDLALLGTDVTDGRMASNITLTRLHARYTRDTLGEDLVFRPAGAIEGGRETSYEQNPHGAHPSSVNNFQARYVIRHLWEGAVECKNPQFGVWGGPPDGDQRPPASAKRTAARRDLPLDALLVEDDVALGVHARSPRPASGKVRFSPRRALEGLAHSPLLGVAAAVIALAMTAHAARRGGRSILGALFSAFGLGILPLALFFMPREGRDLWRDSYHFALPVAAAYWIGIGSILALRDAPRAALSVALAPAAFGLLRTASAFEVGLAAARDGGEDAARILAESQSEALALTAVGLWSSALLCVLASWSLIRGKRLSGLPTAGLFALGIAACAGLRVALGAELRPVDAPLFLVIALSAMLAHRGARDEAWRLVAGAAMAGLLCGLAALVQQHRFGLGAVAGYAVSLGADGQALRILARMTEIERARALLLPIDMLAAAGPAILAARRAGSALDAPARRMLAPALGVLQLLAAWGVAQHISFDGHLTGDARRDRFSATAGLTLPFPASPLPGSMRDPSAIETRLGGPALLVNAGGSLLGSVATEAAARPWEPGLWSEMAKPSVDADAASSPLLAADTGLRLDAPFTALDPLLSKRQTEFSLLQGPRAVESPLAARYRALVDPPRISGVRVVLAPSVSIAPAPSPSPKGPRSLALGLLVDGETASVVVLTGRAGVYEATAQRAWEVPLRSSAVAITVLAGKDAPIREVVLACPPSMQVGELARVLAGLLERQEPDGRFRQSRMIEAFVVTTDRAAMERAVSR